MRDEAATEWRDNDKNMGLGLGEGEGGWKGEYSEEERRTCFVRTILYKF